MLPCCGFPSHCEIMGNGFVDTLDNTGSDIIQPDPPVCYSTKRIINARCKTHLKEKNGDPVEGEDLVAP
ncbi:hypothetical protein TNCV_1184781 [Trichonephila clavipes]|nr:hypothetical protein TNCV_1184781 [Trichonephila clavipes]